MKYENEILSKTASVMHFFIYDGTCHRRMAEALFCYGKLMAFVKGYGEDCKIYKVKDRFSSTDSRHYNKQFSYAIGTFEVIDCTEEEIEMELTKAITTPEKQ